MTKAEVGSVEAEVQQRLHNELRQFGRSDGSLEHGLSNRGSRNHSHTNQRPNIHVLDFEHDLVTNCSTFVSEATAPFEPRLPLRRRAIVQQQFPPSKSCSAYECERVGDRSTRSHTEGLVRRVTK